MHVLHERPLLLLLRWLGDKTMKDVHNIDCNSWIEYKEICDKFGSNWIFRGQSSSEPMSSTLERALKNWYFETLDGLKLEEVLLREFRRLYDGPHSELIQSDTLYCISVMQHYGSPTRLLDFSYSPYVAAYFALNKGKADSTVYCINREWVLKSAVSAVGSKMVNDRNCDAKRNDSSFIPLYMTSPYNKFAFIENPVILNDRLIIQQGTFICQGDVSTTLMDNIRNMNSFELSDNISKISLKFNKEELHKAVIDLRRMNADSATLFPGIEGYVKSLNERIPFLYNTYIDA